MKIFELVGKYHYGQVVSNKRYRDAVNPNPDVDIDVEKFKEFLKRLDDMNEDKNKGNND